jgi:muramoyltetrapeptide carboxypeptidase
VIMRKPSRLVPGDRVAIVAPASPFDREAFDQGVAEIRRLGLMPVITEGVFARRGYVAGDAIGRAEALTRAWCDPSISAVMAARGGYGSAQLLPFLDTAVIREFNKPFIGYSDLTALLVYLTTLCNQVCFHGPMVVNMAGGEVGYDRDSFRRCLMSSAPIGELAAEGLESCLVGEASGPLLGGTLTQLVASLGTPFAFDPPPGYILLLDEIGERPYRIDRMLTQLTASGVLARAAAVVCGEFPNCDESSSGRPTARGVVADLLETFHGPVIFGLPTGHTVGPTLTVPLGVDVRVVGGSKPRVVVTESAVA